jgi:hypothetical protein
MSTEAAIRRQALALPDAYEDTHRGHPAFRIDKKIFAMLRPPKAGDPELLIVKLGSDDQHNMLAAHPDVVVPATHFPHHGWTRVWWEKADDALIDLLLRLAWLHVAPKRLHQAL